MWDKRSIEKNNDGSLRVFSKFIPISNSEITKEILYTMDINCSESTYKDVRVGVKEIYNIQNKNSHWESPKGDSLILGVIKDAFSGISQ